MTLAPDEQSFRYTKYTWDEVFSLLIGRGDKTGITVAHASAEQGRRITVHVEGTLKRRNDKDEWVDFEVKGEDRVAVLLGRSSEWYKYRLNVYAHQANIEWIICGTHDTCVNMPVWSVEEERLYNKYQTRIEYGDLLGKYKKYWFTEFGHKLLLGGMICNIPEAKEVVLKLKPSARFAMEAEVRKHAHKRKGPTLKLDELS